MTTFIHRHRIGLAVTAAVLIALYLLSATTPPQCKVPFKQLPQRCLNLLYPN